ncbi:hypothetical protein N7517_005503 [Penicillium concentricum]|uniref:Uncharacterized protein n=1 Tax=Penicillium concentricum TaxID=293559 RepID=A0A9W9V992_9EURO|nr:uncharacterized protein N7517_005503 [Penicillium concentricum]KAJ5373497.1 hypothetical protein N7517_005503 [Penicillium concentricum]
MGRNSSMKGCSESLARTDVRCTSAEFHNDGAFLVFLRYNYNDYLLHLFTRNVSPYFDTHSPIEGADVTRGSLQKDVSNCEGLVLASF